MQHTYTKIYTSVFFKSLYAKQKEF